MCYGRMISDLYHCGMGCGSDLWLCDGARIPVLHIGRGALVCFIEELLIVWIIFSRS